MYLQMEGSNVLSSVTNILKDDYFLEKLENSMTVQVLSSNVAEMSETCKKLHRETNHDLLTK